MTEEPVLLSITMKLMGQTLKYEKKIEPTEVESSLSACTREIGVQA
jgi:hypothetical protein